MDKKTATPETENQQPLPAILVHTQYIKDMSLEIPHAPEIFKEIGNAPEIKVDVDVQAQNIHDNVFNVELSINLNGDIKAEKLFICELKYCGVVSLNVPEEKIEQVLLVEIPRLLFPFSRSIITNGLVDAGLPPIMLNPIDFAALYNKKKAH